MRIVIPGGSGQIGSLLARHFRAAGHHVTVIGRNRADLAWNARDPGPWTRALEGCDVVINLAGRSVDCRYNARNRRDILQSRIAATRLLGDTIQQCSRPPRLWMNASTATIYNHSVDRAMDEQTGQIGGSEPGAPSTWAFSVQVATAWEKAFFDANTPDTRKVALRSAMTMSPDAGGVFDVLLRLVRFGLGGTAGPGNQYVSWIHDADFLRAMEFLIAHEEFSGAVNLSAPEPLPNRDFMRILREAWGTPIGLPASAWMLEAGAFLIRTETELILKSRRVVPGRLQEAGFRFDYPEWRAAATDLVKRWRQSH